MQLNKLQELHAKLRKAKYFYYEKHESIMSDYEFDMMESEYKKLAEVVGINDKHNMATQFVGFDAFSPMNLNNFYSSRICFPKSPHPRLRNVTQTDFCSAT